LNSLSLILLNSFYSVFIVLIIYSQQLSTYIHEATMYRVIVFVAQKKKES